MSGNRERDGKRGERPRKSRFDDPDERKKKSRDDLDPLSPNFSPIHALYTSKPVIPNPKAPAYDNLSKYESVMEGKAASTVPAPKKSIRVEYDDLPPRDLTDTFDNVKKWMKEVEGPMKAILVCIEKKIKVKVITRDATGVRGYVLGYVAAFDKLWNLAIEEVTEVWTRPIKRKTIPKSCQSSLIPSDTQHLRMTPPEIKVTKLSKKMERCERRVDKLLLRGEHIVLISMVDY